MINTVNLAIVGLGRIGKMHAENLAFRVKGAHVQAACSLIEDELLYARETFGDNIHSYTHFDELLEKEKNLDAVFLASSTEVHAEQVIKALKAGLHVFCEKPLALNVEDCLAVEKEYAKHRDKVLLVGFVRRFDPSYQYVKQCIESGELGKPYLLRSQTADKSNTAAFQIDFIGKAGGGFLDMNVHDIDLAHWYLSSTIVTAYSVGGAFEHPAFAEKGDFDAATTLCKLENGTMAEISGLRLAPHGHATYTQVLGTKKWLSVGYVPARNQVYIADEHGMRQECVDDFFQRFRIAFQREAEHFVHCIQHSVPALVSVSDSRAAIRAAFLFSESYKTRNVATLHG